MPLALRRAPQICPSHFDLRLEGLDEIDLSDEAEHSQVYDTQTKILLAKLLRCQCNFALVLTDILMMVYSPRIYTEPVVLQEDRILQQLTELDLVKDKLSAWFSEAEQILNLILQSESAYASTRLYSELIYMCYQYVP